MLEKLKIFSTEPLGKILLRYPHKRKYDRQFAGSLTSEFYSDLQKGVCGKESKLFVKAIQIFLNQKNGKPGKGRPFWKLPYQSP